MTDFLFSFDDRLPWKKSVGSIKATEILRGSGETGLSIVVAGSPSEPSKADLQAMWKARAGQSADPVLLIVEYPTVDGPKISVFGPDRDAVAVSNIEVALAERLAERALESDSPVGLVVELRRRLSSLQGSVGPGFRNEGLFASHVLAQQPQLPNWSTLCSRSNALLPDRGEQLLQGLGYKIEHVPDGVVLRDETNGSRRAAAVLMLDQESFENPLGRFAGSNAVAHGLALARRENVPWLILIGGSVARLFPADPDVGVGRKGQTQTYAEVDLDLLTGATSGYLSLLFSPEALAAGGTVAELLDESSKYATGLSDRLRDRIYEDVIPSLATAVAARSDVWNLPVDEQKNALEKSYHQAMVILFRMLFVAYAEDRELLPLGKNEAYTANALNTLARRMLDDLEQNFSETSTSLWNDLTQIWQVIDTGDLEGMGVPAYNGGLFTQDKKKNPVGAATYKLRLNNSEIGPVIRGLMIDNTSDGFPGLVDFRSLDVREFGTIYEGLLESGLAIADSDLTVDNKDTFVPAKKGDDVIVEKGSVYFHSRSGSRKATGSYFTKPFAVQHLLNQALEPALDDHLERVKGLLTKGANKSAAEALFGFRVADLSMGSAHFLVAAVDRIEARFSAFIAENPMPEVQDELHKLRTTAATQLGLTPGDSGIDDGILLRRQIARRCIYGMDLNELAVELARLALWIHTFVPGLPLSFLSHGLVYGNSLSGVGTIDEIVHALTEAEARETKSLSNHTENAYLASALEDFISRVRIELDRLGGLVEASVSDVIAASTLQAHIDESLLPLNALCDLIVAERLTRSLSPDDSNRVRLSANGGKIFTAADAESLQEAVLGHPQIKLARELTENLRSIHYPVRFPEVFGHAAGGFDVQLGNPPWDKVRHEPQQYWVTRAPGLNALASSERTKRISQLREQDLLGAKYEAETQLVREHMQLIAKNGYHLLGGGHYDFAKMFAERYVTLSARRGQIGVVLPQAALMLGGWARIREAMVRRGSMSAVECRNGGGWLFDQVHHSTAVALLTSSASREGISIYPGVTSMKAFREMRDNAIHFRPSELEEISDAMALPWFNSARDRLVFDQMRDFTTLGSGKGWVVGQTDTRWDFSSSGSQHEFTEPFVAATSNRWRILKARHVDAYELTEDPFDKQVNPESLVQLERGVALDAGNAVLEQMHPAIVYRFPSRNDDSRTLIATALPESGYLYSTGYCHGVRVPEGTGLVQILGLLGYLNTVTADWWARRFVDRHVGSRIVAGLVLPNWTSDQVDSAASCAGQLLIQKGFKYLPGHLDVAMAIREDSSSIDPRVKLEALAALGFGLNEKMVEIIFDDFAMTPAALTKEMRQDIISALSVLGSSSPHVQVSERM